MKEIKRVFGKYKIQLLLVLFLILIISRFTYHSDLFDIAKGAVKMVNGDLSLSYKSENGEILYASFFPPMFHFIDTLIYYPFVKFGLYNFDLNHIAVGQYLQVAFLLKLRYLVLFVLSLFLIVQIAKDYEANIKQRNKIFLLWLLCPVLIFIPFSWGNNDIYPTVLLLFFLLFAFKKKNIWAMIFLGLSAATKNFGLFLLPIASLVLADKKVWRTFFYGLIAFLVYIIPWFIYKNIAGTGITSGGEGLFVLQKKIFDGPLFFPLAYFSTLLVLMIKQKITKSNKNEVLVKYCLLSLSWFYLASFFIPHWFLWIMPFFVLTAYKNKKMFYLYLLINITFFISIYSWSRNIDMNLFSVAFPVINKVMTLGEFIVKFLPEFKVFEIIFALFFASFGFYLYLLVFDKKKNNQVLGEREINIFSLSPLFLFLLISFIFVFGMVVVRNRDWYDLGLSSRREIVGPIYNSGQFYQTFKSPNNNLMGINLFLSTYMKKITTPYKLVLYGSSCKEKVLETNIDVGKIIDNAYREVLFPKIEDSKDKEYCFTVEPNVTSVDTPISLHYSKLNSYSFGELIVGKKELTGEDVVFQLIYPLR